MIPCSLAAPPQSIEQATPPNNILSLGVGSLSPSSPWRFRRVCHRQLCNCLLWNDDDGIPHVIQWCVSTQQRNDETRIRLVHPVAILMVRRKSLQILQYVVQHFVDKQDGTRMLASLVYGRSMIQCSSLLPIHGNSLRYVILLASLQSFDWWPFLLWYFLYL